MHKILLVEDSVDTQLLITNLLPEFEWCLAASVADARKHLADTAFIMAIVDIGLPDGNGLEFFSELQNDAATRSLPIIILTAQNELPKKVLAFSLGSEDFIAKPFEPEELRARVLAKIEKFKKRMTASVSPTSTDNIIACENITINFTRQKAFVTVNGVIELLDLTQKEFKLLAYLMQRIETVVPRKILLEEVWGPTTFVVDRTIDSHISRLRKKMVGAIPVIEALSGSGYRITRGPQVKQA